MKNSYFTTLFLLPDLCHNENAQLPILQWAKTFFKLELPNYISILFIGLQILSGSEIIAQKTVKEDNLFGPVHNITISKFNGVIKDNSVQKIGFLSKEESTYDNNGNEIEYKSFRTENIISFSIKRTYTNDGHVLTSIFQDFEDKSISKDIYQYDENNNKIECANYLGNQLFRKYQFKYDVNNRLTEESSYDYVALNGKITYKAIYLYDILGNLIEKTYYSPEKVTSKYRYNYDALGNVIEEMTLDANGNTTGSFSYKYDGNGRKIEEKRFDAGKLVVTTWYSYDDKGRIIEKRSSLPGRNENYEYPVENLLKETLDSQGNWLSIILPKNGEVVEIIERNIVYY